MKKLLILTCCWLGAASLQAQTAEVSDFVKAANQRVAESLDFNNTSDFEDARRGFIASDNDTKVLDENGALVYDFGTLGFLETSAPDTVNPSLWRQSQLTAMHGLYKVRDGIYQVRGYDLANITFIAGEKGWIVVDPLTAKETALKAKALVDRALGERPISAVVVTHSHGDHYGGVRGIINEQDLENGVELIAPEGFVIETVSENVLAGNAMSRRVTYMFGAFLPPSPQGNVGVGLGPGLARGNIGLLNPTIDISETGQSVTIDGVKMDFILTLGAEAPSEFMFYLPKYKAFCQAEIINHTLHNMLTPRGAKVRDGRLWSKYIDQAIYLYGDKTEVSFGSHHWPTWERENILDLWSGQRDLYRYIHDQTLWLSNQGVTLHEIPSKIKLPDGLSKRFANRGYYGDIGFNARSQYQLYYGFFDGNPANLNPLAVKPESVKYVEYMGGAERLLVHAIADYNKGEFQFVATALNHLVFAEPENQNAKNLLARTYKQMAYLAESGAQRNFYLSGALELENGVPTVQHVATGSADTVKAIPLELYFDLLAVRINGFDAADKTWSINFVIRDTGEKANLFLSNGALHHRMGLIDEGADATLDLSRDALDRLNLKTAGLTRLALEGEASIEGNPITLAQFFALIEEPPFWFNIVTP